LSVSVDIVNRQ